MIALAILAASPVLLAALAGFYTAWLAVDARRRHPREWRPSRWHWWPTTTR